MCLIVLYLDVNKGFKYSFYKNCNKNYNKNLNVISSS